MLKVIALLAFLGFASMAQAEPPTLESIDALLKAARTEKLLDTMLANVDQSMRQSMATVAQGQQLTAQQQQVIDAARDSIVRVLREEITWDKMRPIYIQTYQETFTQEEVDGLIAFYNSPAGIAYVEKMPMVLQKTMAITRSRMAPMMEKMKAAMQQAVADTKAAK
jgi:uncharacterized protein